MTVSARLLPSDQLSVRKTGRGRRLDAGLVNGANRSVDKVPLGVARGQNYSAVVLRELAQPGGDLQFSRPEAVSRDATDCRIVVVRSAGQTLRERSISSFT